MPAKKAQRKKRRDGESLDIMLAGELDDRETDVCERILEAERHDQITIYFDSPGGSPYVGLALANLIRLRGLDARGVVIGECSSSAILPWAACSRRYLAPHTALMFHPMRWESDQNVTLREAAECARHYHQLEQSMDALIAQWLEVDLEQIKAWCEAPKFVSAEELIRLGVARPTDTMSR